MLLLGEPLLLSCHILTNNDKLECTLCMHRMTEAVTHYGESIKAIMNEELGDGIMSAIDMYATVCSTSLTC